MKRIAAVLLILIVLMSVLVSCKEAEKTPENLIVGSWSDATKIGKFTMEMEYIFYENKNFARKLSLFGYQISEEKGTYSMSDTVVSIITDDYRQSYKYQFEGKNTLILRGSNSEDAITLKRK